MAFTTVGFSRFETVIAGRIGKEPEMTYTSNGSEQIKFSVSTKVGVWDKDAGKMVYPTVWHSFTEWSSVKEQEDAAAAGRQTTCQKINEYGFRGCPVIVTYVPDIQLEERNDGNLVGKPRLYQTKEGYADANFGGRILSIEFLGTKADKENARSEAVGGNGAPKAQLRPKTAPVPAPAVAEESAWE